MLTTLRVVAILHVLAVFVQAVYAGQFLSGSEGPVRYHELTGWGILVVAVTQLALSALWGWGRSAALWLVLSAAVVLIAELLQIGTGYGRFPGVHIPLGVLIFGGVLWQMMWLLGEPRKEPA